MAPSLFFTARGRLVLMLFLGNISLYLSRANITVAIVYMFPGKDQIKGQLLA